MRFCVFLYVFFFSFSLSFSQSRIQLYSAVTTGAAQTELYLPMLKGKRVALVTNASGLIGKKLLVDSLLRRQVKIVKIFGPEHGFRGTADAGEKVKSGKDPVTGIPVVSLYGSHKKPTKDDLAGIDVLLYDIQDVGVRFYTYISTMTYVMEACAENKKQLIILDRPNPNGFYIDGPVMTDAYKSFLGMHSIPLVYGMTCGEYAKMVNGERWLKDSVRCELSVIPLKNYDRSKFVSGLPVKPSPNIPNDTAVLLYPALGLFEGTIVSVGRGTDWPFQYIGNPWMDKSVCPFSFKPRSNAVTKKPKYQDTLCYGINTATQFESVLETKQIQLDYLSLFYSQSRGKQAVFFDRNFNYHAGNETLQQQVIAGKSSGEIRDSWQPALNTFKEIRKKYLIYDDF
jgi:uncharacterized protein YbbC (DUF1343 family)